MTLLQYETQQHIQGEIRKEVFQEPEIILSSEHFLNVDDTEDFWN